MNTPLPRRQFLATSAAFAGSLLVNAEDAAPKRKLRKAVMYATVPLKGSVAEKFKGLKEAGFEGVEPMGGMNRQEVIDALHGAGLEAASVCCHSHWKETLTHQDAETRKRGIEGAITTLQDAKAYGAGSILLVPGVVNAQVPYDVAWKRSQEAIRELIPVAKEAQVRISIENVWNHFLLSPLEMARFIDELDSPWVGSHFDIGNVVFEGWPEQWIHILGKRINRLHFKEFSVEKMRKEGSYAGFNVDFLAGSNNWKAIMQALDDVGYTGWCITEQGSGPTVADMHTKLVEPLEKMFAM
jgi:L-ribulose-5-phosphate 3-epimerase